jgi:hypothetical protein
MTRGYGPPSADPTRLQVQTTVDGLVLLVDDIEALQCFRGLTEARQWQQ